MEVRQEPETVTRTDFQVPADLEDPAICPAGHLAREQTPCEGRPRHATLTFEPESCESCDLLSICPVKRNDETDGYVVMVDLKAINLARRRRARPAAPSASAIAFALASRPRSRS